MVQITWFGHAAFSVVGDDGFTVLIDPWLGNPKNSTEVKNADGLTRVDAILLTHGHFDHVGDTVEIAKKFSDAKIYCIFEIAAFLGGKGVAEGQLVGLNKGGEHKLAEGWRATLVNAVHSSGCGEGVSGGEAGGWIINEPSGNVIYHTGDTDLHSDMEIITKFHKPNIALACIGDHFTMGPKAAGFAFDNLLTSVKTVVPMHFGTFPLLTGTPEALKSFVTRTDLDVKPLEVGVATAF